MIYIAESNSKEEKKIYIEIGYMKENKEYCRLVNPAPEYGVNTYEDALNWIEKITNEGGIVTSIKKYQFG